MGGGLFSVALRHFLDYGAGCCGTRGGSPPDGHQGIRFFQQSPRMCRGEWSLHVVLKSTIISFV